MFDRRGVSEALGFVMVFGIIVAMAGVVYATGFSDLQDARDFEQGNNAQRAFDVLKANVEDISKRGAPSRGTEVKLSDAQLYTGDPVRINVTVAESGAPLNNETVSTEVEPLVYDGGDNVIVYANGAIFRRSPGGVVMIQEPEMAVSSERVLLPVIRTYTSGSGRESTGGSQTVLVRTLNDHSDGLSEVVVPPDASEYNVTISMETPRAGQWVRYFEDEGFTCSQPAADELECGLDGPDHVEHVQVTLTRIKVIFE